VAQDIGPGFKPQFTKKKCAISGLPCMPQSDSEFTDYHR
jgi:hypothetical protein